MQPVLRISAEASPGSESLDSEDVSSSEGQSNRVKSFSFLPSELGVSTVLQELLSEEDVVLLSGLVVAWCFLFFVLLPVGSKTR